MAYVNFQRLLDLNADQGEAMAQKGLGGPDAEAQKSLNAANYSAMWHAGGLNNEAELANRTANADALGKTLSGAGAAAAVPGGTGLDAALMGRSSTGRAHQARSQNLQKLMGGANAAYASRQQSGGQYGASAQKAMNHAPESEAERQARAQREQWRTGSYKPKNATEYAAYSDYIQSGRR